MNPAPGCSRRVVKYLLFTINLLFLLAGIFIFGLSVYVRVVLSHHHMLEKLLPSVDLLIGVGALTLVSSFLGCCGAVLQNRYLLLLSFIGLLLLFLMVLVVGIWGVVSWTSVSVSVELMKAELRPLLPLSAASARLQGALQWVQQAHGCCGLVDGPRDWGSMWAVPGSCSCSDRSRACEQLDGRQVYSTPCSMVLFDQTRLDRAFASQIGVSFAFAILLLLDMALTAGLFWYLRSD